MICVYLLFQIYTGCYDGSVQAVKLNLMQNHRCWVRVWMQVADDQDSLCRWCKVFKKKLFTQHILVAGFHLGVEIKKTDVHIDVLEHIFLATKLCYGRPGKMLTWSVNCHLCTQKSSSSHLVFINGIIEISIEFHNTHHFFFSQHCSTVVLNLLSLWLLKCLSAKSSGCNQFSKRAIMKMSCSPTVCLNSCNFCCFPTNYLSFCCLILQSGL